MPPTMAMIVLSSFLLSYSPCAALRLPMIMTSNMVLPAERPVIFGWASTSGAQVSVAVSDGETAMATAAGKDHRFEVELKAREASLQPFNITISEAGTSIVLSNLLAGDVWVCSGQSNMAFSVAEMFGSSEVIKGAAHQGLRLFAVQKNSSKEELDDLVDRQYADGWVEASPSTVCGDEYGSHTDFCVPHCGKFSPDAAFKRKTWGYFSAVCFVHGLEVLQATGRPQGLLESAWGGTHIRDWQSAAARQHCGDPPTSKYPLWEGMITPLLPIPVRGVVWYQGEADSQNLDDANKYECQLKAMITDWRARFAKHPEGDIKFTIVQISASGDKSGGALRLAQQAATALTGTSIVVTTDLFDATSPCGSVHIRNKSAVGRRAALASLASTYGRTERFWTGPIPDKVKKSNESIIVDFSSVNGELAFEPVPNQTHVNSLQGFEATANEDPTKGWTYVPAQVVGASSSVVVDASRLEGVRWLRYSWGFVPSGEFLYDDGGRIGLPAGPFLVNCTGDACLLVEGGHVPGHLPPAPAPTPAPPPAPTPPAPQPPTPTESNCTFQDLTTYQDPVYKQVKVELYDYRACCELCHTDPDCAVAQMHHGQGSANYDYCMLMSSALRPQESRVSPPSLELACLPSRSHAQIV